MALDLANQSDLENLLQKHNIDTSCWIKPVSELWKEIQNGESILVEKNGTLKRRVHVANVVCRFRDLQLYEEKQVFKNGTTLRRGFKCVSEKIMGDENPQDAAKRGLQEELGIPVGEVEVLCCGIAQSNMCSETYTGLKSQCMRYEFECEIPEKWFKDEYVEVQESKSTYFKWESEERPVLKYFLDHPEKIPPEIRKLLVDHHQIQSEPK